MKPWPAVNALRPAKQYAGNRLGLDVWTRGGAKRSGFWGSGCEFCVRQEFVRSACRPCMGASGSFVMQSARSDASHGEEKPPTTDGRG